ncbi:TolC family protein [Millionella massiliensis]|uniref:TolC family protein n=1 Tax=Millionella massiliensis TaxID=1871023 RepID=UPI0023A8284D|nr:TolC family protein [Millionella massiliensis]
MKKIILMSAAALTLSSCGIYKKYQPATTVPDQLYGEELSAATDTASFGNLTWKEVFTDPYLQTLIDSALVRNTDMQTAHLKIKEAEAALLSARLAYVPSLNFTPQGTVSSFDGGKASQTYSIPVAASWEIDIFGKLTNAKRQALAGYEQTKEYAQAVKTQLVAGVANTYYTLLMLDAQYEIAVETETAWKASVETTRAMKEAGMVTEAALAQTEATYYSVCTTVHDLKEQINQAQNSLCLLLAETPRTIERGKLAGQQFPESFSVGIPLQMLSNRPDVRSAEQSLAQAFYGTNAARAAFYPTITLSGSAGWTNSAGGMIVNPGKFLASAVASLTQPLFNRAANIAQLRIAKAQQEEAQLAFEQTLLNAGVEVNEAVDQYQTARNKANLYEKQVAALETAATSTQLLMQHGNTTYLEVLTAQQSLLSAQLNQVANRFTEIQGIITLYQALGGGRL